MYDDYDKLNWHHHDGYTEMTDPSSLVVNVTDKDESKEIIVQKNLLDISSTDVSESERNIVNKIYRRTIPRKYQRIILRN